MRGYLALSAIIAVVLVTAYGQGQHRVRYTASFYEECGIKAWTGFQRKYYAHAKGCYYKGRPETDPVNCQRRCQNESGCKVFNLRARGLANALTCELFRCKTYLVDLPMEYGPETYSYIGGKHCMMDAPKCFVKNCFNSRGRLTFLHAQRIATTASMTPVTCQNLCKQVLHYKDRCTHTTFGVHPDATRPFITCRYYSLQTCSPIELYYANNDCTQRDCANPNDPYNRWSGPVTCPSYQTGTKKVRINL